ncbi:ParA family protein, partial [Klebsiella pneumoniae]|nr:ParA family protein [Klebsiella pneumoniae]
MRVVTRATSKGGSGKSTLTASLAVAAAEAGRTVVVLDADPQRSLARWLASSSLKPLMRRLGRAPRPVSGRNASR